VVPAATAHDLGRSFCRSLDIATTRRPHRPVLVDRAPAGGRRPGPPQRSSGSQDRAATLPPGSGRCPWVAPGASVVTAQVKSKHMIRRPRENLDAPPRGAARRRRWNGGLKKLAGPRATVEATNRKPDPSRRLAATQRGAYNAELIRSCWTSPVQRDLGDRSQTKTKKRPPKKRQIGRAAVCSTAGATPRPSGRHVKDQKLFSQQQTPTGFPGPPGAGKRWSFQQRPAPHRRGDSSVDEIVPRSIAGEYSCTQGKPTARRAGVELLAPKRTDFFSSFISGAHRRPNGNTFICSGANGDALRGNRRGRRRSGRTSTRCWHPDAGVILAPKLAKWCAQASAVRLELTPSSGRN